MSSLYRGGRKFDREQMIFVAECILIGALDHIESDLPHNITLQDRLAVAYNPVELTSYERGCLEAAGVALGVFYAQLAYDGLGVYDALACAGDFHLACERLVEYVWSHKWNPDRLKFGRVKDIYAPFYPDTRQHAVAFVDTVFRNGDYPRTPVKES